MSVQKVGIVTECICDLPRGYLREHNVGVIYFLVRTDRGVFTDTDEITAENVLGYMVNGDKRPISSPPAADVYEKLFRSKLGEYEDIIYISTGSGASTSYSFASEAAVLMGDEGKRVRVYDSKHLSTGLGHMVINAVEMAEKGCTADEIISALDSLSKRVSTSFIVVNADYLYLNKRVPASVKKLCDTLRIHPVLTMRDGSITLKSVIFGGYEGACLRYVRRELRKANMIDKTRIFITHAGCSSKKIDRIKAEVSKRCAAEKLIVTKASATVSCNCGPDTFGILFVRNDK